METFDLAVIGGGPAGYPAAIRAAQLGASVALIEKDQLGGTCLNWGCIPTKALMTSAERLRAVQEASDLGIRVEGVHADYAAMSQRKNDVVGKLRQGVKTLLQGYGVKVIEGSARFSNRYHLDITAPSAGIRIAARKVLVATGSRSLWPAAIPAARSVVDSQGFLALTSLPPRLVILGGGIIGCELAGLAAQLGVKVTVVEILEDILGGLDRDVRAVVRRHMEARLGIRILTGRPLERLEVGSTGVKGCCGDASIEGDLLVVAVGRRPVTEDLGLDKVGLSPSERGALRTDASGQTERAGIYAAGDVVEGSPLLAHAATAQGLAAAENAVLGKEWPAERLIPSCIFTRPEVGCVGWTEERARLESRPVRVGKFPFAALGRALAMAEIEGFVKWIADAETDQLLGAAAVGAHATELIAEATLAIRGEWTAAEVARTVHCHPTLSEAWMEAAHAVHGRCVHAPRRG